MSDQDEGGRNPGDREELMQFRDHLCAVNRCVRSDSVPPGRPVLVRRGCLDPAAVLLDGDHIGTGTVVRAHPGERRDPGGDGRRVGAGDLPNVAGFAEAREEDDGRAAGAVALQENRSAAAMSTGSATSSSLLMCAPAGGPAVPAVVEVFPDVGGEANPKHSVFPGIMCRVITSHAVVQAACPRDD
jgi:hypothetical protein